MEILETNESLSINKIDAKSADNDNNTVHILVFMILFPDIFLKVIADSDANMIYAPSVKSADIR